MQSNKVIKISRNQKIISKWTYLPPEYGESWEEKWKREKKASEVTATSSTDDLMMGIIYGENYEQVSEWLMAQGSKVLPKLIEKTMQFPNSTLGYVLGEMVQKFPEESKKLLTVTFDTANYDQKKMLVPYLVGEDKEIPDSIKKFLIEMSNHSDEDRDSVEQFSAQLGLDTSRFDSAIEQLRKGTLTEDQVDEISWHFFENRNIAFEKLLPIVKDPSDPIRVQARTILLKILIGFNGLDLPNDLSPEIQKLASDRDEFVSGFAAVVMVSYDAPEFLQKGLLAVKQDNTLLSSFVDAFRSLAENHPEQADSYSEEVLSIVIEKIEQEKEQDHKWKNFTLPATLGEMNLPKMQQAILQAVSTGQYSREVKSILSYSLSAHLDKIPKKEILKIIVLPGSTGFGDNFFYLFLKDVNKTFTQDPEIRAALRSRIISDLSTADSTSYSSLLAALDGIVEKDDLMIILQFLDMGNDPCGGYLVNKALDLLDQIGPLPDFQERWISFFQQTDYAVRAGKILAQDGYPPALEVMILGLQSEENYKISARHFKAFNGAGETQLISLLSSTNNIARNRAAEILGELKSELAFPILRKQFEDTLQDKKLPDSGVVVSLMYYGQDPISEVVAALGSQKYGRKREENWENFPTDLSKKAIRQLEELIFKEEDPKRAGFLINLLNFTAFKPNSAAVLERVQKEHPLQEIRDLVPSFNNTHFLRYID